jgi:hypothetical protein
MTLDPLDDLPDFLVAFLPFLISFISLMLIVAGWMVARKYGALTAYVAFVWVIPVVSIVWLKWEDRLGFDGSFITLPFLLGVVLVSFLVGIVCLPLILYLNWRQLSVLKIAGLILCGLSHAFPSLLFAFIWVYVIFFGK